VLLLTAADSCRSLQRALWLERLPLLPLLQLFPRAAKGRKRQRQRLSTPLKEGGKEDKDEEDTAA
jgi:hypothetical protein